MVDNEKIMCDLCGKSFNSRKQLEQHKQDIHSAMDKNKVIIPVKKSFKPSKKVMATSGGGILVAIVVSIVVFSATAPHIPSALTIGGIQCSSIEQLVFHIHSHLDIFINGKPFTIPAQIGIIPGKCFYWLHTHDESGVIHIESPVNRNYTLGQFFDIWNQKFNNTQLFDHEVNGKTTLTVYVNGSKVSSGTNYRDIKLGAHNEVAIVYGTPPTTIPSSYVFAQGL
jgi:Zinc-finger of C2H2 type